MKAVYAVSRTSIIVSVVFYIVMAMVVYSTIRYAVFDELDETLYQRLEELRSSWQTQPLAIQEGLIGSYGGHEWVEIHKWNAAIPSTNNVYHTILLPEPNHKHEQLEYRRLTVFVRGGNALYEVSITRPMMEWQEIITTLNAIVLPALFFLLVLLHVVHIFSFRRLFAPLSATIEKLASIRHSHDVRTVFPSSSIDEFATLHTALNALLQRLDRAFEEQKEFLQNASHELQTPLALLRQQTEQLLQDTSLPEHLLLRLASIQETIARIARLNRALLLIGKIESGQFVRQEEVQIHAVLHGILDELKEFVDAKQLSLHLALCDSPASIVGNRDVLYMLFYNLLQNAVKFSPEQGELCLDTRRTATEFIVRIGNQGSPILPEQQAHIFQRFKKVHTAWSDSPGLGLSIVKSICDTYGYTCTLETGSTYTIVFIVAIPLQQHAGIPSKALSP